MKLDLRSFQTYKDSSLKLIKEKLIEFYGENKLNTLTLKDIDRDIKVLNAYPGIKDMKEVGHKDVHIIDENVDTSKAEETILNGQVLWEHAAAGEATRLGLGTKYLLDLSKFAFSKIKDVLVNEAIKEGKSEEEINKIKEIKDEELKSECACDPSELISLSLGLRHMLQLIYDIRKLADKKGRNADEVVKKQKMFIILNESTCDKISKELALHNFLGLNPENVLFMEQKSFHGISLKDGELFYDENDSEGNEKNNKRLHNHGQMVMQKLHDDSIFRVINGERVYLKRDEFLKFLEPFKDMISYNIEDLSYLTNSIDLQSLATALELGEKGYDMVMEVVGQNPKKPQKGASLFFDPRTKKNVMIESFRLFNLKNEDLKLMNKNFNHYPNTINSIKKLFEKGLPLGFEVKEAEDGKEYIYLCTVQGDINFLVNTAFVTRKELKPIYNWKTGAQTTQTIKAMHDQDKKEGFKELAEKLGLLN